MNLWIGNLDPAVTDDELKAFVAKYGCPAPERIERVPGDGSRPAAVLFFPSEHDKAVGNAQLRLHGMYWKNRQLFVQTTLGSSVQRS
jgi:RNA recognition motif-containing protein